MDTAVHGTLPLSSQCITEPSVRWASDYTLVTFVTLPASGRRVRREVGPGSCGIYITVIHEFHLK